MYVYTRMCVTGVVLPFLFKHNLDSITNFEERERVLHNYLIAFTFSDNVFLRSRDSGAF